MGGYYFLLTAFPPLDLGQPPGISLEELRALLKLNLSEKDLQKVRELFWPIDLTDIRAFWLGMPLSGQGTHTAKEWEEILSSPAGMPGFLQDFLDRYDSIDERLKYFSSLYASFYGQEEKGFLERYFRMEREIRLILAALRAKRFQKNLIEQLQFEDPADPLVAYLLAQKDASEISLPIEYEDLKSLFVENISDPEKLHLALLQYRFERIEEMEESQDFGIDRVLAYLARFLLVDGWWKLDRKKGESAVEKLSRYG